MPLRNENDEYGILNEFVFDSTSLTRIMGKDRIIVVMIDE